MRGPERLYAELAHWRHAYATDPHDRHTRSDFLRRVILTNDELRSVLDWLEESAAAPRGDLDMVAVLQAEFFARRAHAASVPKPRWRHVPGGRVQHVFMDDAAVPLCGVVPSRPDGTLSPWRGDERDSLGFPLWCRPRRRHGECDRLLAERGGPRS